MKTWTQLVTVMCLIEKKTEIRFKALYRLAKILNLLRMSLFIETSTQGVSLHFLFFVIFSCGNKIKASCVSYELYMRKKINKYTLSIALREIAYWAEISFKTKPFIKMYLPVKIFVQFLDDTGGRTQEKHHRTLQFSN